MSTWGFFCPSPLLAAGSSRPFNSLQQRDTGLHCCRAQPLVQRRQWQPLPLCQVNIQGIVAGEAQFAGEEIAIGFKQAPYAPFQDTPVDTLSPNWLVLHIAPGEGVSLQFEVKRPGPVVELAAVKMDFHYNDWFPKEPNAGYETLLYDVMIGDPTLFMRADMVEQAWRVVQPVLDAWAAEKANFPDYVSGSDGPKAADELLAREGDRAWRPVVLAAERQR